MEINFTHYIIIAETIGGLGIFLIGMLVMTDGLHGLAGDAVRRALTKFTKKPLTGALTGAVCTAILQSSSATTVAAVGFVSAGLLNFSQALGIIFGANLGTTVTGWLVVLLGFKLKLGTLLLPVIFIGALLRLFAKEGLAKLGFALAGFGLIFVGISLMQQGMSGLEYYLTPEAFPPNTWFGRVQLLLIGISITLVTQSSSAGVAMAMTALFAGAINFNQAATLVIGMDIGTTFTAAIATLGGSVDSKRTGFSHVIYNLLTAILALALLTPFTTLLNTWLPGFILSNSEIALVSFHSLFNLVGVLVVLPLTNQFSKLVCYLVPRKSISNTEMLDSQLLKEPSVALIATLTSCKRQLVEQFCLIARMLNKKEQDYNDEFSHLQLALKHTHEYIDQVHLQPNQKFKWQKLIILIHVLDHMYRLNKRIIESHEYAHALHCNQKLSEATNKLIKVINLLSYCIEEENWSKGHRIASKTRIIFKKRIEPLRADIMREIASGVKTIPEANIDLEVLRWMTRIVNHINRITYHLNGLHQKTDSRL
ncbi:Na/Pi cotransporter family protein [Pseudoalteromonas sp.]|uniref:Na/Pi cotransporter family protein n=1 Tax=Pseudoalteromonas sp. TaxID=53249 RepID=UPI003562943C